MKKHYRSEKDCLNCGTTVPDKFCPNCGQENLELHDNFLHLALHSVGHYFHFESKLFNSVVPLFTKPGFLTKEYFAGKRASHLNPISMYIFISILFFFLFITNTNINKKDIVEENAAAEQQISQVETRRLKEAIGEAKKDIGEEVASGEMSEKAGAFTYTILDKTDKALEAEKGSHSDAVVLANPLGSGPDEVKGEKQEPVGEESEQLVPQSLREKFLKVWNDDLSSELFKNKLIGHLPKVMFILLPLFALILKLVYRRTYYIEHLIYSIHVHSFLFLFGSILILLSWMLPFLEGWLKLFGFLVVLLYIYRSMRNIYESSRWRTIYKFCLLSFAYGILFAISTTIVVVATLYTV